MLRLIKKLNEPRPHTQTLKLPWEQRTRSRLRVVLDNGEDAGIFLPRGTILRDRDLLVSTTGDVVMVCAAPETLSMVTDADPLAIARACYHLGNRHAPIEIRERQVQYLHDPVLDDMVKGLGLAVRIVQGPFEPELGAYTGGGHHHG